MYLIKSIDSLPLSNNIKIDDGITIIEKIKNSNNWVVPHSFWGVTKIHLGEFADISKFCREETHFLSYASDFSVTDIIEDDDDDGDKEFTFHVNTYEPENIEGYIVCISFALNINTNGKKLLDRNHQIVVLLRKDEFLEFNGKRLEVIDNHLMLHI